MTPKEKKEYMKEYRSQHAEELKAKKKEYRSQHAEELKAKKKEYYSQHADKLKAKMKEYYSQHADKLKAKKKEYRSQHADKLKAKRKEYYANRRMRKPSLEILTSDFYSEFNHNKAWKREGIQKMAHEYAKTACEITERQKCELEEKILLKAKAEE
jgi:hypothetical protein